MNQPNILYIHSHDTGRHVQPYGHAVATPRMQRLAEGGVLFRQAFCVNPTCSPSRAAMLTGVYPHECGMTGLVHRGARLIDPSWHLAAFLRSHGYATALAGVQHEAPHGEEAAIGYEQCLDQDDASAGGATGQEAIAARAARFIERHDGTRPFLLTCGFYLTHRTRWSRDPDGVQWHNGDESPQGDSRYVRPPAPLPDTPVVRQDVADFTESVQRLDRCMGTVFDALDRAGLTDKTLVICTTDHGIAFPLMKCSLTDHGTGVMLILRGPGGFTGGRCVDAMVSHLDLFPTICELASLDPPARLRGRSLVSLAGGAEDPWRDELCMSVNYHAAHEPMRAVRTARWKYIRRWEPLPHPVLPNCDDSPTKSELLRHGWRDRGQPAEALFDLMFDPTEAADLAPDPRHAAVLADLRGRLDRWMHQTADPLLHGLVPPDSYRVNPVDDPSPQGPVIPFAQGERRV